MQTKPFNLMFDFLTILSRCKALGIRFSVMKMMRRPRLDIQDTITLFNGGIFKGATLDNYSNKKGTGADIIDWYTQGQYEKIVEYIQKEAKGFIELYQWLMKVMPEEWAKQDIIKD